MVDEAYKEGEKQLNTKESILKKEWILFVILILPFVLIAVYWDSIPAKIPLHWNIKGEANKFGDKMSVFDAPFINICIALLLFYLPRIDPRKRNYDLFPRAYRLVRLTIAAFFFVIFFLTISPALGIVVNVNSVIFIAVPLLFLIMGNFMRSFRQNYFAGIRTPWTLDNPEVWEKTHKFASWIWTGGSLLIIVIKIIVGNWEYFPYVFFGYIGLIFLIPIVMSYFYHKQTQVGRE